MISISKRKNAFFLLGHALKEILTGNELKHPSSIKLRIAMDAAHLHNPWFTEENVEKAISSIASVLQKDKIEKWVLKYTDSFKREEHTIKRVGIVMAGNIPLVGFHDFLSVLISGNIAMCKLSSDDQHLLPALSEILIQAEPEFENFIQFEKNSLKNFDAVIATGSNNTARYFNYYFGRFPHIIRKNRNAAAILTGQESTDEIIALGEDIFSYFGMGCRSVSKLFIPENYDFHHLFKPLEKYADVINHHKYNNNYDYYKSIYLVNKQMHYDNGFLLLKEEASYASPPSVLFYEFYDDLEALKNKLEFDQDLLQCVVGSTTLIPNIISFGKAQSPELWDYADGIDSLDFLLHL